MHSSTAHAESTEIPAPDLVAPVGPGRSRLRQTLVGGDLVALTLAWTLPALTGSSAWTLLSGGFDADLAVTAAVVISAILASLGLVAAQGLYRSRIASMRTVEIARIGRVAVTAGFGALLVSRAIGEEHLLRIPLLVALAVFLLMNLWRGSFAAWLNRARRQGRFTRPVILVGANDDAFEMFKVIGRHPELGYRVVGVVGPFTQTAVHDFDIPWLGDVANIESALQSSGAQGTIVIGSSLRRTELNWAIRRLLDTGVHVHMSTGINGIDHRRMRSHSLGYEPMVYLEPVALEGWQVAVKRSLDVVGALTALVLSAPLIGLVGLAIKLTDRGPVFFKQDRVGRGGRHFGMLKIRSMVVDAERQLIDLADQNQRGGPLFKLDHDPRITRIGKFIRATSIDELPQLVNVLKGEMSLVGPRPALPTEVATFDDDLQARQNVMPGITGLWQVEARDDPDFGAYQRLDLFYVENWSVALDISILAGTVKAVIMRSVRVLRGSRNSEMASI